MRFDTEGLPHGREGRDHAQRKILTDEQGKPIKLSPAEAAAQVMGFRPQRMAQISGEHWTMKNVKKHFAEKRNDLYARFRLAKTKEQRQKVIRDKPFMAFEKMMEASP